VTEPGDHPAPPLPAPLPRWGWPAIGLALVVLALFALSLRFQRDRPLEVVDPDALLGPAELVEAVELGRDEPVVVADGPFVHEGRLAVPLVGDGCPKVRAEARLVADGADGETGVRLAMRVTPGGCGESGVVWLLLADPEDPSLLTRAVEVVAVPLD
jgi:hypothetical protein